ncbi:MAG: helix-turn-helix domain-containing protein [Candidatus Sulfotelmatobacter sp.]
MESDSVGVERRRLPFTLVENVVLEDQELGPVDLLVYIALAKHADSDGVCWPSMATLGKLARCARETVARSIARLEARGYLRRSPRFRDDGGVTSNAYRLMPIEVKKYPAVTQDDSPCDSESHPPVILDHTNYIQSELEPNKEREERATTRGIRSLPDCAAASEPSSLSSLLSQLKQEAREQTCPFVIGRDWREGIGELVKSGTSEGEILQAFQACIATAPERVTFFPRDFLKWRKVSRERTVKIRQRHQDKTDREVRERELAAEREVILRQREDPRAVAEIAGAIARLPWRR